LPKKRTKKGHPSIFLTAFDCTRSEKQQTQPSASDSCFFYPLSLVKHLKIEKGFKKDKEKSLCDSPEEKYLKNLKG